MRFVAAWLLLGVAAASPAGAQSKAGTSLGQFVGIEPSARIAAMGNAGAAVFDGIQAVYYNPAALGALETPAVQLTHSLWFADITYDYIAGALPVRNWGTFYGAVTSLNSGDILVRTVEFPLGTGERYSVNNLALNLGYGRTITSRFGAGIQINYFTETIWHSSMHAFTVSVGTAYRLTDSGIVLGASLANFGTHGKFGGRDLAIQYDEDSDAYGDNSSLPAWRFTGEYPVPILFRVGVSVPQRLGSSSRILWVADAHHPNDNTESLSGGAEWSWKETFDLRAGYQRLFQEDSETGLTLGLGIRGDFGDNLFSFDYAWADHDFLQETHRMTFTVAF